jgi:tagatose 6-phosphate kinase
MILCVGATPAVQRCYTVKRLVVDEVNRAASVQVATAGKGINVGRVGHTLGMPTVVTGFAGGDTGQFIKDDLDREGIPHQFIEVPFRTRTCTTIIDQTHQTVTELVEESKPAAAESWQALERLIIDHLPKCKAMVLSGALPPNSPADFYARCCHMAQPFGVPVIVDSKGEPLRLAVRHGPVLVKPNRHELASTFDFDVSDDAHFKAAIHQLVELGARNALITMGSQGAVFCDGKNLWTIQAPKIQAVNPIGSGDSVSAGFVVGMVQGLPLLDCAILGIACGTANALTDAPGVLLPADVDRLKSEVRVTPM